MVVSKENQVLKSKLNELKVAVARKTARMAELEGNNFSWSLVNSSTVVHAVQPITILITSTLS